VLNVVGVLGMTDGPGWAKHDSRKSNEMKERNERDSMDERPDCREQGAWTWSWKVYATGRPDR
jgi:hypothetical protein